jgi:hypothetical protein
MKRLILAVAAIFFFTPIAEADLKLKSRMTMGGQSLTQTTYVKGARQRSESDMGIKMITIQQCDKKQNIQINEMARTYLIQPFDEPESSTGSAPAENRDEQTTRTQPTRKGGIVTYTTNMVDTGERKQMFGFTARHIKTSMSIDSTPDACSKAKMKMETDGWYIDFEQGFSCPTDRPAQMPQASGSRPECRDQMRFKSTGTAKMGYPLLVTTTMYGEDGRVAMTTTQEVVELSRAPLDAQLFDVPAGYTLVKNSQDLFNVQSLAKAAAAAAAAGAAGEEEPSQPVTANAAANTTSVTLGPKKPGILRIGVAVPKATAGEGMNSTALSSAIQGAFINYLKGPVVEVVDLQSRLPIQITAEAKQKECDFVLFTEVLHKKGGGGFGSFMKKASPVAGSVIPMAGIGTGVAGAVATTVATTAVYTVADVAGSIKAKDEVNIDYKLQPLNSTTPTVANKSKARAKSDNEDVITPLVEQAASAILTAVAQK